MTSTTDRKDKLLKVDVLGRVTTPPAQREALLDEFERSGMSGQAFARHVGVNYQTFAAWIQKRRRDQGAYPAATKSQALSKKQKLSEQASASGAAPKEPAATIELFEALVDKPVALGGEGVEVTTSEGYTVWIRNRDQITLGVEILRALGKSS